MFNKEPPRLRGHERNEEEPSIPAHRGRAKCKFMLTVVGVLLVVLVCSITRHVVEHQPVSSTFFAQRIHRKEGHFSERANNYPTTTQVANNYPSTTRSATTGENEIIGWERDRSRETTNYIDPFMDTTIISGREICENPNTTIVIICTTRSSDFFKRAAVRETWGSHGLSYVRVGFLLGLAPIASVQKSIEHESGLFHDIIQENLVDSYMNLTLKSISLLKWYIRWCPMHTVLVKADDDSYVDVKMLVSRLVEYRPNGNVVGYVNKKFVAPRDTNSIYYVPKYIYPNQFFPDYVGGPAYFMSRDAALKLYNASLETPIFHLEDVYITGICAQKANVTLRHFKWAAFWEKSERATFDQKCLSRHVFCHPVREWEMPVIWEMRNKQTSVQYNESLHNLIRNSSQAAATNDTSIDNSTDY